MNRQSKIKNFKEEYGQFNPDLFKCLDSFEDVVSFHNIPEYEEFVFYYETNTQLGFFENESKTTCYHKIKDGVKKILKQSEVNKLLKDSNYKLFHDFILYKQRFPNNKKYKHEEFQIVKHLMLMLDGESLVKVLDDYFSDESFFDENFVLFHKSMRQTDFYDSTDPNMRGHLDIVFWNFIYSSTATYEILKDFVEYKRTERELINLK